MSSATVRARLEELLKKRFFFQPSFSIYGGVAGLYDYGPPGCALQANLLSLWRSHFIIEEQMLEVDTSIMTLHDVLKTSGHVDRFTDYMVRDAKNGDFFRADHLLEAALEKKVADAATPEHLREEYKALLAQIDGLDGDQLQQHIHSLDLKSDSGNDLTEVVRFNLMFGTEIGPTGYLKGFLRPETAQGIFTNFKRLLECNNEKMPFAAAQIGKSFRNEISPRSGLLRVREFTMAEIEHFVDPQDKSHPRFEEVKDMLLNFLPKRIQESGSSEFVRVSVGEAVSSGMVNNETLGYFLARTAAFLHRIGIKADKLRFRQHLANEMAHYASDCWDAEILSSYGWIECVGCADRSCYDLTMHAKATGEKLVARERLPEPITQTVQRLDINKRELGQVYKSDSKEIVEILEKTHNFNGSVTLKDGRKIVLAPEMAQVKQVQETMHVREYVPAVIEPSFGIGRILYSLLEHVFYVREGGDEQRAVLALPACVAPTKCLLTPLSSGDPLLKEIILSITKSLRRSDISFLVDESSTSIGKRYSRNDEVGVPFAVTVDFESPKDEKVTLRERDSTQQVRMPYKEVARCIHDLVQGHQTWDEVVKVYGLI